MNSISDSDSFYDKDRMLSQHQAALTLLQAQLVKPTISEFYWLDLACGRGQIISNLDEHLSLTARSKVNFVGYDVNNNHSRTAQKRALSLGLKSHSFEIGDLASFHNNPQLNRSWDFITLTNTIHEIAPSNLASIIVRAMTTLSEHGCLFIYDMEQIDPPELGAIMWTKEEFQRIVRAISKQLGSDSYEPEIGRWRHKTCTGWNFQVRPTDMNLPPTWRETVDECISTTSMVIIDILKEKHHQTHLALESITEFGTETVEESQTKQMLLYNYWAISRALGVQS